MRNILPIACLSFRDRHSIWLEYATTIRMLGGTSPAFKGRVASRTVACPRRAQMAGTLPPQPVKKTNAPGLFLAQALIGLLPITFL